MIRNGLLLAATCALLCIAPATTRANEEPPTGVCLTLNAHPGWARAVKAASARWDVPPAVILAFVRQESNFKADLRHEATPGPYGYPQATLRTWKHYQQDAERPAASRNNFADSVDFVGWYASATQTRTGAPYSNVNAHYLAYSRGPAPIGPAKLAARRNAARVVDYAAAYEKDLATCPLPNTDEAQVAALGG